jgi:hypothetical protein
VYSLSQASAILIDVAQSYGKTLSQSSAETILESCNNNVRHGINEIQFMISTKHREKNESTEIIIGTTDKSWNLFKDTESICNGIISESSESLASSDLELATLMLHQNMIGNSKNLGACTKFLDYLSFGDVIQKNYLLQQGTYLILNSASMGCKGGQRIQFPAFFGKMSSKNARQKRLRLAGVGKCQILNKKTGALAGSRLLTEVHPTAFQGLENLYPLSLIVQEKEKAGGIKKLKAEGYWIADNVEANDLLRKGLYLK